MADIVLVGPLKEDVVVDATPQGLALAIGLPKEGVEDARLEGENDPEAEQSQEKGVEDSTPQVSAVTLELPREDMEILRSKSEYVETIPWVEEKIEGIRVKQESVDEFVNVNPPNPTPIVRPVEEVSVKQEFIEKWVKSKHPLKERYQSQFHAYEGKLGGIIRML